MTTVAGARFNRDNIRTYLKKLALVAASLDGPREVDLMVYGGSALMLASNFREATDDIDAFIGVDDPTPVAKNRELRFQSRWLENIAGLAQPSSGHGGHRWLDTNVSSMFEQSPVNLAGRERHLLLETHRAGDFSLNVWVPDKTLMLAMKVKSMRIDDDNPSGKPKDLDDLVNLLALHPEIKDDKKLMEISASFFPEIRNNPNVIDGAKQLFTRHRDRARHAQPTYAERGGPAP